jgi:hypothetical protein
VPEDFTLGILIIKTKGNILLVNRLEHKMLDGICSFLTLCRNTFSSISRHVSLVSDGFLKDRSLAESTAGGFFSREATVLTGTEISGSAHGSGYSIL